MRILSDQGVPVPLRRSFPGHEVETAFERGWSELTNGELLDHAEEHGYSLLITTDQNLRHQQSLHLRTVGVVVLQSTSWPRMQRRLDDIVEAAARTGPGEVTEVPI